MIYIISLILPLFSIIFVGFILGKILRHSEQGLQWMNIFVVYVALPALLLKIIAKTPFEQLANWPFIFATSLGTVLAFILSYFLGMLLNRKEREVAPIQGIAGAYSNIGYMGPALTLSVLGPQATIPTALIFCFDNIIHFTMVPFTHALTKRKATQYLKVALKAIKDIMTHPFIIASIVGVLIAYSEVKMPIWIETMISYLSNAAAPSALFVMGVTIAVRPMKRLTADIPVLIFIKLILHPLLTYICLRLLDPFEPVWVYTALIMASLPPALNVFILAKQCNLYVERAFSIILIGTVLSIFTLSGLIYLISSALIPLG